MEMGRAVMSETLFSQQWYRVSRLTPRVRPGLDCVQHVYRKQPWYVIKGASYGDSLRINATAYHLMQQFDGKQPVEAIWQRSLSELGDDAPTQSEVIALLTRLFNANVISFEGTSDLDQLFENRKKAASRDRTSRYGNPLFMRFGLFNPTRIANALLPLTRWLFSRTAFAFWCVLMVIALIATGYAWDELSGAVANNLTSRRGLIILWFVFPLMKVVHELAHAIAIRRFGGQVAECGLALLVLLPVPYIDGSDSVRFSSKFQRMSVAAAGIVVETTLAAFGLAVWCLVEPGLIKDIALVVAVTGSVSSVLFNGNPLLKFDAYYVLCDFLEIPNLSSRARDYPIYLVKRYLFGIEVHSPATAPGERFWLAVYGVLSGIYRVVLTAAICLYVASHYFFIGVAIAVWAIALQIVKPFISALRYVLFDPAVRAHRTRVNSTVISFAVLLGLGLFVLQIPHVTAVRGVVWPQEQAVVRAGVDCFVQELGIANGARVEAGELLLTCEDQQAEAKLEIYRAEHLIVRASLDATRDRVDRELLATELEAARELLQQAQVKNQRQSVVSPVSGEVHLPSGANLVGNFVRQGDLVGYVIHPDRVQIRTLLNQERVALIERGLLSVDVRLLDGTHRTEATQIIRRIPAASDVLNVPALGENGGGKLTERPSEDGSRRLAEAAFEMELALPARFYGTRIGEPVELRFVHGTASPAQLLYRELQLLLLSKFNV